jgi:K+-transporting ATPase KdpF subunit
LLCGCLVFSHWVCSVWLPVWRSPKVAREFEEASVIYLTAVIATLLFIYLGVALVRPEWF